MSVTATQPDYSAIKQRQQATWASGDYAIIGTTLQLVGERLCDAVDIRAGERVLDVAAGNGNATLAAARQFAVVTSTDYVDTLLHHGRARAEAERLPVTFRNADVERLPFDDGSFDVVLSTFGVMFAPDQVSSAREMTRVVRPGGRIGMANWTPDGFIGQLFKIIGRHVPPPAGVRSPAEWGVQSRLADLFPGCSIRASKRFFKFRYKSPAHWLEIFRTYYGPTHRAFAALDMDGQQRLEGDILHLLRSLNVGGEQSLVIPSEYLEIVVTR